MAPSDPHTGGTLESMAATGTTMPNDAGRQNVIPSGPRDTSAADPADLNPLGSRPDIQSAAGNAFDAPRRARNDAGATGEVVSGVGAAVPASVETKRTDFDASKHAPGAKGHGRDVNAGQHVDGFGGLAAEGAGVDRAPGEEEEAEEEVRAKKGL
ncbi:ATP-dependent metalloprotease [Neofusicoccum parvum]|uniref:ATP-dependent metalloprotease n=1 Tax=Neofusicoccum parvum TaxID=310453 RepID=A0ACB5S357_9PEZI|nr:ATP-dependent metalloprotease [Neofusicoccum parvum]